MEWTTKPTPIRKSRSRASLSRKSEFRKPKSESQETVSGAKPTIYGRSTVAECTEDELTFWGFNADEFEGELAECRASVCEGSDKHSHYDLPERTARFGEAIIQFAKTIPFSPVSGRLIDQLVGSGTSIGANYCEADDAISSKDYRHRISICRKEAKETCFWLRMIVSAEPSSRDEARLLWRESMELNRIFGAIWRKTS